MFDDAFTKQVPQLGSAHAEAAGLEWLREASEQVVAVISVSNHSITTSRVNVVRPTMPAAYQAGEELAKIHLAGAEAFGCPPPSWDGPNFIGTQQQTCIPELQWAKFYIEQRVAPFVRAAVDRGNITSGLNLIEQAMNCVLEHDWPEVEPARIHGDLWAGNLIYGQVAGQVRPFFIDPAAHGGHPETDLAMLALFNAPYLVDIYTGYQSVNRLAADWQSFIPVHQLHPLAVHAVTHGPGYGHELVAVSRSVIRLLG